MTVLSMNCRPGDLAYIVAPFFSGGRGRVVQVVRTATAEDFFARKINQMPSVWLCVGDIVTQWGAYRETLIGDECLRPIRDPGDDAIDEILQRFPSPAQLEALS